MSHARSFWYPLLGLGFAIAGAGKLLGASGNRCVFHGWGWSRDERRLPGASEFAWIARALQPGRVNPCCSIAPIGLPHCRLSRGRGKQLTYVSTDVLPP